jgi:hypothetical protein
MHRDTSFVQYRPQKSLDMPIERFLASVRFEHRSKLDHLGIEIRYLDTEMRK